MPNTKPHKLRQEINNIDLLRLQEYQLSLAILVRQICEKHNIPYFLIAGTLLGAVRHKGFIPWDDDLDIGMLRENYDRFIAVAQSELDDAYFLQTYKTDQYMPFPYAKLRINGTIMREKSSQNCKWNTGISIDIFPFDGVPENNLLRLIHKLALKSIGLLLINKCEFNLIDGKSHPITKHLFLRFINALKWLFSRQLLIKAMDISVRLFSAKTTRFVMASGGSYGYKRETIPRNWIEQPTQLIFCDTKFDCPSFWHDYLTNLYGDYMKPPPIENRSNRHGIVELKFQN